MYLAADLISNFIEGLKLAKLTPKRFLLQTGAKHYGFHIGPATSPSYEFDARVRDEDGILAVVYHALTLENYYLGYFRKQLLLPSRGHPG